MKKIILGLLCAFVLLSSCKETDHTITYVPPSSYNFTDTSYVVSSIPAADPHNVLIEDFTGQTCPNCPTAHTVLDGIISSNPGRVNAISLYAWNINQAVPPPGSLDLRDSSYAFALINDGLYPSPSLPSGGIDRSAGSTGIEFSDDTWAGQTATELLTIDSINLAVSASYNSSTNQATITTTITYVNSVSSPLNLTLVLVQDSILASQEFQPYTTSYPNDIDTAYVFNNVSRGVITKVNSVYGDPVLAQLTTKPAGETDKRIYTYTLPKLTASPTYVNPAPIVAAHCRIVAFITNGNSNIVLQSEQCPLIP